ncbi:MAG: hypothetical protein IKK99_08760 [Oscillospiraceae bacterium]|nr:hypothetical protein [Oscillospiraceae bacterium]
MKILINKKLIATLLAIITTLSFFTACGGTANSGSSSQLALPDNSQQASADQLEEHYINLNNGLVITDIGSYTGIYMEDGSDEVVSGVLMMVVKNTGDKTVQYAKITLETGETDGLFELTTLPPSQSVVLLEQTRMSYDKNTAYTTATTENLALFSAEPSLMTDKLELQVLDGVINVTNISDNDIDGEIVVYYKNSATELYYGGITYRSRITGGLKAGEIRQVVGAHLSKSGTAIMFVTIA